MSIYTVDDFPGLPLDVAKVRVEVAEEAYRTRHDDEITPEPRGESYADKMASWEEKQARLRKKYGPAPLTEEDT